MGFFRRKETDFFELFVKSISFSNRAALSLQKAFENDVIDFNEVKNLKSIEHEADEHVHKCLRLIEAAFVTPIDRFDIIEIVKQIENVTDCIDAIANQAYMMNIKKVNEPSRALMDLIVKSCSKLEKLMVNVKNFKKNAKEINELIIEINHIEEDGDRIYREAMRKLFEFEPNVKTIVTYKLFYEELENTLDACEDVADSVQKIIISKT